MSHAPRPKAYCTFCAKVRTMLSEFNGYGVVNHGPKSNPCPGTRHPAKTCPSCNGVRTVRQNVYDITCNTCKGTGRIVE